MKLIDVAVFQPITESPTEEILSLMMDKGKELISLEVC
jgi:hypothetical protein